MHRSTAPRLIAIAAAFVATAVLAQEPSQAELKAQATVSESAARATALAKVHKGKVRESELENENGKLVWSFDIARPKTRDITEVQVDAKTGKVVSTTTESPSKEAREAKEEKREAAEKPAAVKH